MKIIKDLELCMFHYSCFIYFLLHIATFTLTAIWISQAIYLPSGPK